MTAAPAEAAPPSASVPAPSDEVEASEVIETAVVKAALRQKPKAWGGLGARVERKSASASLPKVEEPSPATAGSVFKPSRKAAEKAAARAAAARPSANAEKIGEISSPFAGSTGFGSSGGFGGGGSFGGGGRGSADETIAAGIAATDYAKPLQQVGDDGQPALLAELATGMLARAGFPCECETIPGEYHAVKVTADEDSAGMLIGRGGQTAEAIEHLVERMASNAAGDRVRMNLDINEYRIGREESLRQHTAEAVAEVRTTGEPYHMESMDARERRIVHMATADLTDITTYTVMGMGGKHVVIVVDDGTRPDDDGPGHEGGDD